MFLGCKYHPGCCVPDDQIPNAEELRERWERKMKFMKSNGVPIVMRECQWNPTDFTAETRMPRILCEDTEESLLAAVKSGELFGFLVCDVKTPIDKQSEYLNGHLFPPVIKRMKIEEKHLSPYMKKRFNARNKNSNQETVVQVKLKPLIFSNFDFSVSMQNKFCS